MSNINTPVNETSNEHTEENENEYATITFQLDATMSDNDKMKIINKNLKIIDE